MNGIASNHRSHRVVLRLGALGDVTLTTGVLHYWHQTRGLDFTVITRDAFAPVFNGHPAVRRVIALNRESLSLPGLWTCWRTLSAEYAGCGLVDLHGTPRSALLAALWRGPVRHYPKLALQRRLFLASGGRLCSDALLRCNVPQRYAMALEPDAPPRTALIPRLFPTDEERATAETLLASIGLHHARPVALHPYATHANKAWAAECWSALATQLQALKIPWIAVGQNTTPDPALRLCPRFDFTNRTSLRETMALLSLSRALVTGDSGPMHLAAGVGVPVVALFGPTTAHWGFFPADPQDCVLEIPTSCRPCGLHGGAVCTRGLRCLRGITTDAVLTRLQSLG